MEEAVLTNLEGIKLLCNSYVEAFNRNNKEAQDQIGEQLLSFLSVVGKESTMDNFKLGAVKWIDSLPENEEELKYFLMDFLETSESKEKNIFAMKALVFEYIDKLLNANIPEDECQDVLLKLEEVVDELIISGLVHMLDDIKKELHQIYTNEDFFYVATSILTNTVVKKITERYISETLAKDGTVESVIFSRTFFVPIILHAEQNILELPCLDDMQEVVKREMSKRNILREKEVIINSFVFEKEHLVRLSYENINDLVIDGIVNMSKEVTPKMKEFRKRKLSAKGRYKELYLGVTMILKGDESDYEVFQKKAKLFNSAMKNEDFLAEISKKTRTPFSNLRMLPPVQWLKLEETMSAVNGLANVLDILEENKGDSDFVYCESEKENWIYLFAVDSNNHALMQTVGLYLPLMRETFYELLNQYSLLNNVAIYKYNYTMNEKRFQKIMNSTPLDEFHYLGNLLRSSSIISNEWNSWKSVLYQPSTSTIQ